MFDDEMLTIEDVAGYLKLKPQTIYKWAQTGRIPGAKFGKEWRFRRSAIEGWIDDQIRNQSNQNAGGRLKGAVKDEAHSDDRVTRRVNRVAESGLQTDSTKVSGSSKDNLGPGAS